ncbi:MAG TPA: histidine kinase [Ideonella sp.]|uniref:sensor histidine kinase n=1 Tax=Ideonella sp. TaxID=1929293 RepID=UPI002E2EF614|nr:histidine kinase [Ideonella sp.]HEX5683691.1 histidine kinase [Ideonella sp.]
MDVPPAAAPTGIPVVAWLGHLLRSWRSVRGVEIAGFIALGLLYGAVDLTSLAEATEIQRPWALFFRLLLSPALCTAVLLLAWLPVDRSSLAWRGRPHALVVATLLGSLVAVPLMWAVPEWLGLPTLQELCAPKCKPYTLPLWQRFSGDFLSVLLPGALAIAVVEMLRRRWRSQALLQSLVEEQAALGRQAMAARLAAMQAQVEPRFLFDVLVDVQQQYALGQSDNAAEQLERLIHHLRVALPRLRDQNVTTLDAEAALLGSYLALRQGLQRQPVELVDELPPALRSAPLPGMLLLPLLQRALRLAPNELPPRVVLRAQRGTLANPAALQVFLQVSATGLCGDDAELAAHRDRLRVLTGDAAGLRCHDIDGTTRFTLTLPS